MPQIGLLNEKALHASLKAWYAEPGDRFEVPVDGFVIDIVRGTQLLEIQTGSLASIKSKLFALLTTHPVRLVHPIAGEKWIVKLPREEGGKPTRRRSPKRGQLTDLFREMVSFPQLLADPNFSLEVLVTREDEVRRYDGARGWRRKGWVIEERRLLEVVERRLYEAPADWRSFVPGDLPTFTVRDLAERLAIGRSLAQRMAYCLRKAGVTELIGRQGRAHLYQITDP